MTRTRRLALTAAVALAGAWAAAAPASAATAPEFSIVAIEFKNTGSAFMDYTDDDCMASARGGQEGEE
jgi:ABC-type sugar transport system substrate-binding protein